MAVSVGGVCPRECLTTGVSAQRGVCLGVSVQGVSVQRGVCPGGVCPGGVCQGGVCPGEGVCPGGCLPRGCLPRRGGLPRGNTPPPVDRMTGSCENITFPQLLLRTVIMIDNPGGGVSFSNTEIKLTQPARILIS